MTKRPSDRALAVLLTVIVVAAVVVAIVAIGSPAEQRARRLDERRAHDLSMIAQAVDLYWSREGRLPQALEELQRADGVTISLRDPAGTRSYEYRTSGASKYELCAEFATDVAEGRTAANQFWAYAPGRQCFRREAQVIR